MTKDWHDRQATYTVLLETKIRAINLTTSDASFAGDLEDSKSISSGVLYVFGSQNMSSNVLDAQEKKQCLTAVPNQKQFLWTLV